MIVDEDPARPQSHSADACCVVLNGFEWFFC